MKFRHRVMALILSMMMVLTFMPAMAFAEDGAAEAPRATFDPNGGYFLDEDEETGTEVKSTDPVVTETEYWDDSYHVDPVGEPDMDGYSFRGWSLSKDGTDIVDLYNEDYTISEDTTFYAVWEERDTAIFDANGGHFSSGEELYYDYPDDEGHVYGNWEPVKEGYVFDGWSLTKDGEKIAMNDQEELDYVVSGQVTFYARWASAWVVTFNANGGYFEGDKEMVTMKVSVSMAEGENYLGSGVVYWEVENTLDYDGSKVFSYWMDKDGNREDFDEPVKITGDTEYTACWEDGIALTLNAGDKVFDDYDTSTIVEYKRKGSELSIDGHQIEGETFRSTDGKVVVGWKLDPNAEELFDPEEYWLDEPLTLYAVWGSDFEIKLNAGEGVFVWSEYGENSKYYAADCIEGETLDDFSGEKAVVNGKEMITYDPLFSSEQLTPPEGKVFEGWYLDEALTQPVVPGTVVTDEFYEARKDEDNRLNLYAKYTGDYSKVTLNANGGYLYGYDDGEVAAYDLVCPAGKVLDLSGRSPEKINEDGEYANFSGWYLDAACTQKAGVTTDMMFAPSADTTLYAKWTDPLPDFELLPDNEDDLWNNEDLDISVYTAPMDEAGIDYRLDIEVSVGDEDMDDEEWAKLSSDEGYYNVNGNTITLHGPAIWEKIKTFEEPKVRVDVTALDNGDNEEIQGATVYVDCRAVHADYLTSLFDESDRALAGTYWEVYKYSTGYYYSRMFEDGAEFDYEITSFKINGSAPKYDRDDEIWYFTLPKGENKFTITHTVYDPETGEATEGTVTETYILSGVTDLYDLELEGNDWKELLPGETCTFSATGEHHFMSSGDEKTDYNFKYVWEITEGAEYADIVSTEEASDNSRSRVTVKAKEGIDPGLLEERGIDVKVEVHLVAKNKTELSEYAKCWITDYYTETLLDEGGQTLSEYMPVDDSVTLTPVFKVHKIVGGKSETVTADDVKFGWIFDPEALEIRNGDDVVSNYDESGDMYTGTFTVTRTGSKDCEWQLIAFIPDEDDDLWDAGECSGGMSEMYRFDQLNPQVYGIKNKTYNGKAQKQVIELIMDDPEEEDEEWYLDEGEAYKLVYTNNKNVGVATVEIVGINEYTGSYIKKTFKINPKGTTLSKVAAGKKSFTATWKKQTAQTTGYQIQYGLKSSFKGAKTKTITKNKTYKATIKSLKSKKYYYVRIRTYKTVGKTKYYSAWSKAKKVKTK